MPRALDRTPPARLKRAGLTVVMVIKGPRAMVQRIADDATFGDYFDIVEAWPRLAASIEHEVRR